MIKPITLSSVALAALLIAACHSSKKTTSSVASTPPATTTAPTATVATAPVASGPMLPSKSKSGVFAPGEEELNAIQLTFKEVTMQTLTDGYAIYTGACTNCHGAKSIYSRPTERWQGIMDEMAPEAKLTPVQKDAVYKYVLSIKATQPK